MNKEEKDEIQLILNGIFEEIKSGYLGRAWEVYAEFEIMLKKLMDTTTEKEKPSEKMKDFIYKIANICYEVSKINSSGRVEPNYSMQQIFDCFDAFEESDEKGREYYKKLEEYVNKNGSPEKNGLMYSPKLD